LLERQFCAAHSPGLVTDRIDPDDSSASRSESYLPQGIFGELVTSLADPRQGCVGERSAHGAALVSTVGDAGAFFLFDTVVSDLADLVGMP
jgi:hypothetical protein